MEYIIAAHRGRPIRFGIESGKAALAGHSGKRLVVTESERKADLVQDMISVLTSFCALLYGRRSARHRALQGVAACDAEKPAGLPPHAPAPSCARTGRRPVGLC